MRTEGRLTMNGKRLTFLIWMVMTWTVVLRGQTTNWYRQLPTVDVHSVAVDAGGIYVVGSGTVAGQNQSGYNDAVIRKYDSSGNELWTREFGTPANDYGWAVTSDGTSVYVAGSTYG